MENEPKKKAKNPKVATVQILYQKRGNTVYADLEFSRRSVSILTSPVQDPVRDEESQRGRNPQLSCQPVELSHQRNREKPVHLQWAMNLKPWLNNVAQNWLT